jgi:hypothetical protein
MIARPRHAVALGGTALVAGSLALAACTDFNDLTFPLDAASPEDGFVASRDSGSTDARDARDDGPSADGSDGSDGASSEASCAGPHLYSYGSHCYRFTDVDGGAPDFSSAESDCDSWGGYLVVMAGENASAEHAFVAKDIVDVELAGEGGAAIWIGLERAGDGGFAWIDGEKLVFQAWAGSSGKPPSPELDKACVVQWNAKFSNVWDNYECKGKYSYVCERNH